MCHRLCYGMCHRVCHRMCHRVCHKILYVVSQYTDKQICMYIYDKCLMCKCCPQMVIVDNVSADLCGAWPSGLPADKISDDRRSG